MMTPEHLRAIKERCERATQGPWAVVSNRHKGKDGRPWGKIVAYLRTPTGGAMARNIMTWGDDNGPADAEFAAHAREDVPALVAEVERLWGLVDELHAVVEYLRSNANYWMKEAREPYDAAYRAVSYGRANGYLDAASEIEKLLYQLEADVDADDTRS